MFTLSSALKTEHVIYEKKIHFKMSAIKQEIRFYHNYNFEYFNDNQKYQVL
ncbi:unnamed protein product [marine sediment metagenome]|uniref:Uncharacterized protein n=1 Tax=marine sediment metagenome TaxID=412755 RepID=X1BYL7_9ZZZZ